VCVCVWLSMQVYTDILICDLLTQRSAQHWALPSERLQTHISQHTHITLKLSSSVSTHHRGLHWNKSTHYIFCWTEENFKCKCSHQQLCRFIGLTMNRSCCWITLDSWRGTAFCHLTGNVSGFVLLHNLKVFMEYSVTESKISTDIISPPP